MSGLQPLTREAAEEVLLELRGEDVAEEDSVEEFSRAGCSCSLGPGRTACCRQFSVDHYSSMRSWCAELTKGERDLVIKAQIIALTDNGDKTKHGVQRKLEEERKREYTSTYLHQGRHVCRKTFLFLHKVGKCAFSNIKKSCKEDGLVPRVHGNTKKAPANALTFEDISHVVSFVRNYAEDHAISLPGRIPGYKRSDLLLLPCSTTKKSVWREYSCAAPDELHIVAYSTFCTIWRTILPNILSTKPMTDLCAVCHKNAGLIMKNSNLSESEKSEVKSRNENNHTMVCFVIVVVADTKDL